MHKRKRGRAFSRKVNVRKAMLLSVARALLERERIQTTEAKAKEVSPLVEKLLTRAQKGDLASRRELRAYFEPVLVKRIMEEIAPRYKERPGGYTRVVRLGPRKSDGAKMAILELIV